MTEELAPDFENYARKYYQSKNYNEISHQKHVNLIRAAELDPTAMRLVVVSALLELTKEQIMEKLLESDTSNALAIKKSEKKDALVIRLIDSSSASELAKKKISTLLSEEDRTYDDVDSALGEGEKKTNTDEVDESYFLEWVNGLVVNYLKLSENQTVSSRDVGRYLSSQSSLRLKADGTRDSALVELKEKYGNLSGFLLLRPDLYIIQSADIRSPEFDVILR